MSEIRTPVEATARYATTVDTLTAAWGFVMAYVDRVGPDPSVTIAPVWIAYDDNGFDEAQRHFSVVVSGALRVGQEES